MRSPFDDAELADLLVRTEGWPVGLYLAALAFQAGDGRGGAAFSLTGDDRLVADYLRVELLSRLPDRTVSFRPAETTKAAFGFNVHKVATKKIAGG